MITIKKTTKIERDTDLEGGTIARPKGEYLTTKQVAEIYPFFGYHTLKDLRYKGISPFPFYRIGKNVRYKRSEIENYINSRKVVANVEL